MAGAPGFEPGNGGIKIRCLTTWLRPILAPTAARARDPRGRTILGPPPAINVRDRPPGSTRAIRRTGDWRPARNDRWRSRTAAFTATMNSISGGARRPQK